MPGTCFGYLGRKWELGLFAQHWWSVAGSSERPDLNLAIVQYFVYYAPPWNEAAQWRIGISPNISYNIA